MSKSEEDSYEVGNKANILIKVTLLVGEHVLVFYGELLYDATVLQQLPNGWAIVVGARN